MLEPTYHTTDSCQEFFFIILFKQNITYSTVQ